MSVKLRCENGHETAIAEAAGPRPSLCGVCGAKLREVENAAPTEVLPGLAVVSRVPLASDTAVVKGKSTDVPLNSLAAEDDDETEESNEPAVPQYGFAGVYRGLGFHYFKTAAQLLGAILLAVLLAIVLYVQTRPPEWVMVAARFSMVVIVLALALLFMLAVVLGLLGSILCLSVPRDTRGARTMIIISVLLEILPLAGLGLAYLIDAQQPPEAQAIDPSTGFGPATRIAQVLAYLCALGSLSFFLLFLSRLSRYFRQRVVAAEAFALVGRVWAVAAGWLLVGGLFACLAWLDANRHRFDSSLIIGVGLFVLITVPLAVWANIWILRGILDLIGSVRHIVLSRTT